MSDGNNETEFSPCDDSVSTTNPDAIGSNSKPAIRSDITAGSAGRVLVMDDEKVIRDVAGTVLKKLGYCVSWAKDGDEALELYKKAKDSGMPFDVVIMDLTIPGGIGAKQAIKKLLEIDPKARAIVSSGYHNDPIMAHFKDYGFAANITKPYDIHTLDRTLRSILQSSVKS